MNHPDFFTVLPIVPVLSKTEASSTRWEVADTQKQMGHARPVEHRHCSCTLRAALVTPSRRIIIEVRRDFGSVWSNPTLKAGVISKLDTNSKLEHDAQGLFQ